MNRFIATIVKAGLIVGTLDILSAFTYYFIRTGKTNVFAVLKFVASGFFGREALTGGNRMIVAGLAFHYFIAFSFTVFFFFIYQYIYILSNNRIITGVVYGIFAWLMMNLIVIPLSNTASRPFNPLNAVINIIILIICIGVPLSFMAYSFYSRRNI